MPVSTGPSSLASPLDLATEYYNHHGVALANGDNITATLTALRDRTGAAGTLHFQVPAQAWTLYCDPLTFTGITQFAALESSADLTIQQTGTGANLWIFSNLAQLVLGTTTLAASRDDYHLTLRGTWSLANTGALGTGYGTESGMISVSQAATGSGPWYLRCNTERPKGQGFRFYESGGKVYPDVTTYVSGTHKCGSFCFGYWNGDIVFESPLITDPYCRFRGWRGVIVGGYGECLKVNAEAHVGGFSWIAPIGRLSGDIDYRYGDADFGGGFNDTDDQTVQFGTVDEPLRLRFTDFGWSGPEAADLGYTPGVRMASAWYLTHCYKTDGLPRKDDIRNIQVEHVRGYGYPYTNSSGQWCLLEADANDEGSEQRREVSYIDWSLVNVYGYNRTAPGDTNEGDGIHHLTWRGNGIDPAMLWSAYATTNLSLSITDVAEYGQFYNVWIDLSGAYSSATYARGCNNTIRNCSLTGKLSVASSCTSGNTATNIKFLGVAREVVNVAAGSQLAITNLYAPAGSTIVVGTGATVTINGSPLAAGTHTISPATEYVTDAGLVPADIPLLPGQTTQTAAPTSDVTTAGWTAVPSGSFYATLDEAITAISDADYCWTQTSSAVLEVGFAELTDPGTGAGHQVRYRGLGAYTASLRQGGSTEIASWTENDAVYTTHDRALTVAQADSITDYTDLRMRIVSG